MKVPSIAGAAFLLGALSSCGVQPPEPAAKADASPTPEAAFDNVMEVTATAYCNRKGRPHTKGAWGHQIKPGMKVIAVSRDLLKKGLTVGTKVKIDGRPGTYVVKDKMGRLWRKRIDIYMGDNRKAMYDWGKRKVTIRWDDEAKTASLALAPQPPVRERPQPL